MGSDINGWVEVRESGTEVWNGVIKISRLVERNYRMFGSLFDHRNYDGFRPIAAKRGVPTWPSTEAALDGYEPKDGAVDTTWVLWSEMKAIDWDELAEDYPGEGPPRRVTRKEGLSPGWTLLFKLMEVLATEYGDEDIRLFAWFDSE